MATFTLDSSTLAGNDTAYTETPIEERGRSIQLSYDQAIANQDLPILGYALRYMPTETIAQEGS